MSKANIEQGLFIETVDSVGTAGKLTSLISDQAKVNIKSLWGGTVNGRGNFSIITDDNHRVAETLKNSDFSQCKEQEVVVIKTPDEKGNCAMITNKLGKEGVNINYLYTTVFNGEPAVILSTDNNHKTLDLFK